MTNKPVIKARGHFVDGNHSHGWVVGVHFIFQLSRWWDDCILQSGHKYLWSMVRCQNYLLIQAILAADCIQITLKRVLTHLPLGTNKTLSDNCKNNFIQNGSTCKYFTDKLVDGKYHIQPFQHNDLLRAQFCLVCGAHSGLQDSVTLSCSY